ncbi:hypothetical protein FKM82_030458 [Ascaphus truei]
MQSSLIANLVDEAVLLEVQVVTQAAHLSGWTGGRRSRSIKVARVGRRGMFRKLLTGDLRDCIGRGVVGKADDFVLGYLKKRDEGKSFKEEGSR